MQLLTGQSHHHLLLSERQRFKICVCFNHSCQEEIPDHTLCFPVVNACSQTITFPTAHFNSFEEFKFNFTTAVTGSGGFHRIEVKSHLTHALFSMLVSRSNLLSRCRFTLHVNFLVCFDLFLLQL